MKDPYEMLGLHKNADIEAIKKRFRELSKRFHPDKNPFSQEIYKDIVVAYRMIISEKLLAPTNQEASRQKQESPTLPFDRIVHNISLTNILQEGFKMSRDFSTEDYLSHFQADITVYIYRLELVLGYQIPLMIPTKQMCPFCEGRYEHCYRCHGKGFISHTIQWLISLPPHTRPGEIVEISLAPLKKHHPTLHIRRKSLRILCEIMDHEI